MFEQLENRQMLTTTLSSGLLTIAGTPGNDTVNVGLGGLRGQVVVNDNGVISKFKLIDIAKIRIYGDAGADTIKVNVNKPAEIHGGSGNDWIQSGAGSDQIWGEDGNDYIRGMNGNDSVYGGAGNDSVFGDAGDDVLNGNSGSDYVYGGAGNDKCFGEGVELYTLVKPLLPLNMKAIVRPVPKVIMPAKFIIRPNTFAALPAVDTTLRAPVVAPLNLAAAIPPKITPTPLVRIPFIERVFYNDVVDGGDGNDELHGNTGNDSIFGQAGNDSLWGDAGNDELFGAEGADELFGGAGEDQMYGGNGDDILVGVGGGKDFLRGEGGTDEFWGDLSGTDEFNDVSASENTLGASHRIDTFANGGSKELDGQNFADPNAVFDTYTSPQWSNLKTKPLFATGGPDKNDINQGGVGDCYFLSGLSGLARFNPWRIRSAVTSLGDGTYAVRYRVANQWKYYRVDADLPVNSNGSLHYANVGGQDSIWVPILEKVFAISRTGANSYASIHGGSLNEPFDALGCTVKGSVWGASATATLNTINAELAAGRVVTVGTPSTNPTNGCPAVKWHAYTVDHVDYTSGVPTSITLRNPWGVDGAGNDGVNDGYVTATASQFYGYFTFGISSYI